VAVESGGWSEPREDSLIYFRSIEASGVDQPPAGHVEFNLWFFYPESDYRLAVRYRSELAVSAAVVHSGSPRTTITLDPSSEWREIEIPVSQPVTAMQTGNNEVAVSRWFGRGGLVIENVLLGDADGDERVVFNVGCPLKVKVEVRAAETGRLPFIPAALVFRTDGLVVTRHVGTEHSLEITEGDLIQAELDFGPLMLGNGSYLLSIGLYRKLDLDDVEPSEFYDYLDKSFEFRVVGSPRLHNELVRHPGAWSMNVGSPVVEAASQTT
jgi:hypothetical protein